MDKIKILQFFVGNGKDGRTQAIIENWRMIDKQKCVFGFATIGKQLDFEKQLIEDGGKIHYISCYSEKDEKKFETELRNIISSGYDIVHINIGRWTGSLIENVARECGVKVIFHSHNTGINSIKDYEQRSIAREHHLARRSELVYDPQIEYWACTPAAAQWMYGEKIPFNKIKIVKDAIDTQRFQYNPVIRRKIRNKYNISNKFVLGHIGRFAYQKNQEFLIDVLVELKKRKIDVVLLMEGIGERKKAFCEKIRELGLSDEVIMLENYEKIEELYQAMDIFVFPSRFEGFGRVLLEAQGAGLKCITSNFVPQDVKVTDNIIFEELSVDKWVDKIEKNIYYNRCDMSKAVFDAGYDLEQNVRQLEVLYQNMAGR